jgi:hypothetical protein
MKTAAIAYLQAVFRHVPIENHNLIVPHALSLPYQRSVSLCSRSVLVFISTTVLRLSSYLTENSTVFSNRQLFPWKQIVPHRERSVITFRQSTLSSASPHKSQRAQFVPVFLNHNYFFGPRSHLKENSQSFSQLFLRLHNVKSQGTHLFQFFRSYFFRP